MDNPQAMTSTIEADGSAPGSVCPLAVDAPHPESAEGIRITILWGRSGLEAIVADRKRLETTLDAGRLANFVDWYTSYLDALCEDCSKVLFCTVRQGDRGVAVVPFRLTSRRTCGIRIPGLELLNEPRMPTGDSIVTDGSDPKGYARLLMDELLRTVRPRPQYIRLVNVLADCPLAPAMADHEGCSSLRERVSGSAWCPVVSEEQFLSRLSKNFARKLRQYRRRLDDAGGAVFSTVAAAAQVASAFEEFLRVESSGWKGEQGTRTALRFDVPLGSFYRVLLSRFADRDRCRIHLMRVGQRVVAAECSITSGESIYLLKIGFDEDYARLSPGIMLLDYVFRHCAGTASIRRLDFTTEMPWMKDWQPLCDDVLDLLVFRRTVRGRLARAWFGLSRTARIHRRAWVGPLYRRLFGTHRQRYLRKGKEGTAGTGPAQAEGNRQT